MANYVVSQEGIYTSWSAWLPCTRLCGYGTRLRVKLCQDQQCLQSLVVTEFKSCFRDCGTHANPALGVCEFWEKISLYSYGTSDKRNFFCQVMNVPPYFTIKSGPIPFTVLYLYFDESAPVSAVSVHYKTEDSPNWFYYPNNEVETILPTFPNMANLPILSFNPWLEATEIKIIPKQAHSQQFCFDVTLGGCHLPMLAVLVFTSIYEEIFLENPVSFTPISFDCVTHGRPYYYQHLHIMELGKDVKIGSDVTKPLYTAFTTKNVYFANGQSVITLHINFQNANQLHDTLSCFEKTGMMYCTAMFACQGLVKEVDSSHYGHFDPSYLRMFYIHDKNECSGPVGCADDRGECINTVGSYYCSCKSPYIGDGYTCYSREAWVQDKRGSYLTSDFKEFDIPDTFCRALFYANISDVMFACMRYQSLSSYGCLQSKDRGDTWIETHPRLDIIIGEDLTNGRIYGYSTLDFAYIMYEPAGNQWFSVPPRQYKNSNDSGHLYRDKILLPNCVYVDERRNEEMFPMQNSRMEVGSKTFAMTSTGITARYTGSWKTIFNWSDLPSQI